MHFLRKFFRDSLPILVLMNVVVSGTTCVYAAVKLIGTTFSPILALLCMSIIFGVYTLNRYTDINEDFSNNTERAMLFLKTRGLFYLSVLLLGGSLVVLTFMQKLTWFHVLMIAVGIAYSYPSIPWRDRKGRFVFKKIKQIPLVKNLAVAFLWAFSVFLMPLFYMGTHFTLSLLIIFAIVSHCVMSFSNTAFNDIRDEVGDRIARNPTLPVLFGGKATRNIILFVNAAWIMVVLYCESRGYIPLPFAVFLIGISVYPLLYMSAFYGKWLPSKGVEILADLTLMIYALGLLAVV